MNLKKLCSLCEWKPFQSCLFSFLSVVIGESAASSHKPVYIEPMSNETVAVGRDATLQCVVKHLQDYKVSVSN